MSDIITNSTAIEPFTAREPTLHYRRSVTTYPTVNFVGDPFAWMCVVYL